jgi:hypothetical protein
MVAQGYLLNVFTTHFVKVVEQRFWKLTIKSAMSHFISLEWRFCRMRDPLTPHTDRAGVHAIAHIFEQQFN